MTVVDLTVSLLGVMIVLPAALLWAEEHGPFRVRDLLAAVRPRRAQPDAPVSDDREDGPLRGPLASASGSPSATGRTPSRCAGRRCPRPGQQVRLGRGDPDADGPGRAAVRRDDPEPGQGPQGPRARPAAARVRGAAANGDKDGDANVCQRQPCNENAGKIPACDVRGSGIVRVCPSERGALVMTFVVTRGTDCEPQVDRVERIEARVPGREVRDGAERRHEGRGAATSRGRAAGGSPWRSTRMARS